MLQDQIVRLILVSYREILNTLLACEDLVRVVNHYSNGDFLLRTPLGVLALMHICS